MRYRLSRLILPCVLIFSGVSFAGAIGLEFDAGNTSEAVDGYVGMAGDGWATEWQIVPSLGGDPPAPLGSSSVTVVSPGDASFAELYPGGGNYLSVAATEVSKWGLARQYAETFSPGGGGTDFDASHPHTISFKIRVDEDVQNPAGSYDTYQDRYYICDSPSPVNGTTYDNSWSVFSFATDTGPLPGKNWGVFDGSCDNSGLTQARIVDTGIPLVGGTVYDMEITVDPSRRLYSAAISDGVNSFYRENLRFRTSEYAVGRALSFGVLSTDATDVRAFSLDTVAVEPASLSWNLPWAIEARFSDGNSSLPDGFRGVTGNGWNTEWKLRGNGKASMTGLSPPTQIVSPGDAVFAGEVSPGGGAYLDVRISPTTEGTVGQASAARQYDLTYGEFSADEIHVIDFEVRLEEDLSLGNFSDFEDRYAFFGAPDLYDGTKVGCSWIVMAFGGDDGSGNINPGSWMFYNGGGDGGGFDTSLFQDSGIALATGTTYQFKITIDPENGLYDAFVSDGAQSASAKGLGFRNAVKDIGRYVHFNGRGTQAADLRHMAVDNLVVSPIPEPCGALLMMLGAALLIMKRRGR